MSETSNKLWFNEYLTLTSVVFEQLKIAMIGRKTTDLTLTSVVFEFFKTSFVLNCFYNLTLTSVVFEYEHFI